MGHPFITEDIFKFIDNLKAGDHICSFYNKDKENDIVLSKYIRNGLENKEKVVCIVDRNRIEDIKELLLEQGINPEPFIKKDQLQIFTAKNVYLQTGEFDPELMINFLKEEINKSINQGYSCVRYTGEMSWSLKNIPGSEKLIEYESKLNDFYAENKAIGLCRYDMRKFDSSLLLDVLNVHPTVIIGTEIYDNIYYISSKEFLNSKSDAQLFYQIKNIKERKALNKSLKQSEYKYRSIFETAANLIISIDNEGIIRECNYQSLKYLGYNPEELIDSPMSALMHPVDIPKSKIALKEILEEGKLYNIEYRMIKKSGDEIDVVINSSILKDTESENYQITCIINDISEQKNLENSLRDQDEKWQHLFNNMGCGVAIYKVIGSGEDFIFEDINNNGLSQAKLLKHEVVGKSVLKIFPGVIETGLFDLFKRVYTTGKAEIFPVNLYQDERESLWIENYVFKLPTGNIVAIYEDKTERYKWEKALIESEERFRIIATNYPNGSINLIDREYRFLIAAGMDFAKFNSDPNDYIGKTIFETLSKKSHELAYKYLKLAFNGGITSHYETKYEDYYYENTIVPIKLGKGREIKSALFISNNITERKKAEQDLKGSEENYRHLVNNINDLVTVLDMNGEFVYVSPIHEKILGYTPEHLMKRKIFDIIHPDDFRNALRRNVEIRNNLGSSVDVWRFKNKSGKYVILECKSSVYKGNDGERITVVISRDITKQKKAELALTKAKEKAEESDRLKSAFLANMSHEIRTPMNGIVGFAKMIDRKDITDEKRSYFIKIINESCSQLLNIVNDILDISKIETGQIKLVEKEFNLNDLMLDIFSFYQSKASQNSLRLYFDKGLPDNESLILIDNVKLRQVLSNLISNALKFTNVGQISFGYTVNNGNLEFHVKDTGIGISKKYHKEIFDRFGQAKKNLDIEYGGTGLGLSISKGFIELMGGQIWLDSKLGKGTTFYFTIPYNPLSNEIAEEKELSKNLLKEKVILIVEDEEVNRIFIEEALRDFRIKYIHAKNGQEAIEMSNSHDEIDLVLMDLKLPIINGFDASREIKRTRGDLPIIAQTALALSEDRDKALAHGCDDYISKPIEVDEFINTINKFMDLR